MAISMPRNEELRLRLKHFVTLKNQLNGRKLGHKGRKERSWVWFGGPKQALQTSKHLEKVVIMVPLIGKWRAGSRSGFESELRTGVAGWAFPGQCGG